MDEKQMRDECAKIQTEWQIGGLTGGLYEDFAVTLAKRAVAAERERCARLCQQVANDNENQDSYHWYGCMDCKAAIEGPELANNQAGYTDEDMRNYLEAAVVAEREKCAMTLQVTRADVSLAAGDLSAQEWRTCQAVLRWMQTRIRADYPGANKSQ